MTVYIVICNDRINSVFHTPEQAQAHIDNIEAKHPWNIWEIIEKEVEGTLV